MPTSTTEAASEQQRRDSDPTLQVSTTDHPIETDQVASRNKVSNLLIPTSSSEGIDNVTISGSVTNSDSSGLDPKDREMHLANFRSLTSFFEQLSIPAACPKMVELIRLGGR